MVLPGNTQSMTFFGLSGNSRGVSTDMVCRCHCCLHELKFPHMYSESSCTVCSKKVEDLDCEASITLVQKSQITLSMQFVLGVI